MQDSDVYKWNPWTLILCNYSSTWGNGLSVARVGVENKPFKYYFFKYDSNWLHCGCWEYTMAGIRKENKDFNAMLQLGIKLKYESGKTRTTIIFL